MKRELLKEIVQWDVQAWSKAITFGDRSIDWTNIHNCLELGGRQGGLSLWLALKGKTVICSDLENTQTTARPLHAFHHVNSLVSYQDIDASNIPYENYFDIIVFKSVIGGIGRGNNIVKQQQVFKEIHKALKPGGKLLFAENLAASSVHQKMRKTFINWSDSWRYPSISEMKDFLKIFSYATIKTTGVLGTFGRNEGQRRFLTILDDMIFNRVCPGNWKYISYGIATK